MLVQGTVPAESNRICKRKIKDWTHRRVWVQSVVAPLMLQITIMVTKTSLERRTVLSRCDLFQPEVLTKDSVNKVHFFNQSVPVWGAHPGYQNISWEDHYSKWQMTSDKLHNHRSTYLPLNVHHDFSSPPQQLYVLGWTPYMSHFGDLHSSTVLTYACRHTVFHHRTHTWTFTHLLLHLLQLPPSPPCPRPQPPPPPLLLRLSQFPYS